MIRNRLRALERQASKLTTPKSHCGVFLFDQAGNLRSADGRPVPSRGSFLCVPELYDDAESWERSDGYEFAFPNQDA